jgi:hypothetical protein
MRKTLAVLLACTLSVLAGSTIGAGTASADVGHVVTIDNVATPEGSGGVLGAATVTIHVDPAPGAGELVKVDFGTSANAAQGATANSTASGDVTPEFPEDFAQTAGTVTFAATETEQTVSVPVLGDNADEANEIFLVNLFNARGQCVIPLTCTTGATIADNRALATITDDDAVPTLSVDSVTHDEGNGPAITAYDFTVTKTGGSGSAVTVEYATANDSATAPDDFAAKTGVLTFPASSPALPETQTVNVSVHGDTTFESDEAFKLNLSNATNATISDGEGVGTITNDDATPAPSMVVSDASGAEGSPSDFNVTLSSPPGPGQTATVDWNLVEVPGVGSATEGTDYAVASGSSVFTAGESDQTISAASIQDAVYEGTETFGLELTQPEISGTGGYVYTISDGTGVGSITDDADAPTLSIGNATVDPEGAIEDSNVATFTVTKSGLTNMPVTVHYATADATAADLTDYTAKTGDLSFASDETSKEITVSTLGDALDEVNETFNVVLSDANGATIADGQGVGTITDDDAAVASFAIGDVTVTEGDSGTSVATLTVTKSGASGQTATVDFTTADGKATSGLDYTTTSGSLSFAAVDTSKTITVPIKGDVLDEPGEWLFVNLTNAANASITDAQGFAFISDNDVAPAISIGNDSVSESATAACTLLVKLSAPSGRDVTVNYTTVNGTAGTSDYVAKSSNVKFVAGDDAVQIKIFARADSKDEPTEKFTVKMSGISPAGSATFANTTGTCSIIDND